MTGIMIFSRAVSQHARSLERVMLSHVPNNWTVLLAVVHV